LFNLLQIFISPFINNARMKRKMFARLIGIAFSGLLFSGFASAQAPASPPATATGKIKDANITIAYSSPSVKGRKIFGDLVPFGKVWRTGANAATVFTTDKEIKVEGKTLAAGKYSLYSIPGEKEWTVIFNSETGQPGMTHEGASTLNPAKNVLEVKVKSHELKDVQERLLFTIVDKELEKGFDLSWDKTRIFVSVK
jgi:hypothetical protein